MLAILALQLGAYLRKFSAMSTNFADTMRDVEKSREAKYKLDEELRFKAEARRNKLLGQWAAERLGMSREETESFVKEVVIADLEEPGVDDVVRKVLATFEKRNVEITAEEIQKQMDRLYPVAVEQITKDYPDALDKDHAPVGDF